VTGIRYPASQPELVLPFSCRGGTGSVQVHYGVTADPEEIGFGLVAVGYDPARFRGFPAVRAEVSFGQDGYRAVFGWVQIITRTTEPTSDAAGETEVSVDLAPLLADQDCPLAFFGYLPTLFDAPANPDHPDGDWVAESFLVAVPDIARTRRLAPVTGFNWGYRLKSGRAQPLPAGPAGPQRWLAHRAMLAERHPTWSFLPGSW
jgi:hypothetical protein